MGTVGTFAIIISSIMFQPPLASEPEEATNVSSPWDGITVRIEDLVRSDQAKRNLLENLRENFSLSTSDRDKLSKFLYSRTTLDILASSDSRYTYMTVEIVRETGYGGFFTGKQGYEIRLHNNDITFGE